MKKKGFTLVELLAVIAILAILVIVAMPNVMEMFNSAKADTFVTEVQKYIDTAKTAFVSDAFSNPSETIYYSSVDNPTLGTSKLDMDGNKDYFIEMDRHGEFKRIIIKDDNFCYDIYASGTAIKFDNSNSKKVSKIEKSTVSVSDVWNSETTDSINIVQDGTTYKVKGCEAITTVEGKTENVLTEIVKIVGVEYKYIPGMTWEEWVNSEYNTGGFILSGGGSVGYYNPDPKEVIYSTPVYSGGCVVYGVKVSGTQQIVKGEKYFSESFGLSAAIGDGLFVGDKYFDFRQNDSKVIYNQEFLINTVDNLGGC